MRMLRALLLLLILALLAFPQSGSEIKRPTADSDAGSSSWETACAIGTYSTNSTAGTLARDAAGQSTNINYSFGSSSGSRVTARQFSTWESTSNSYSALTLNINSSSNGSAISDSSTGNACILYSVNSGTSWTQIRCDSGGAGWTQNTSSVSLSATQDLSKVRVGVCVSAYGTPSHISSKCPDCDPGSSGSDNIRLYDIWTSGTLGSPGNGNGSGSGNANAPVQFN